MPANNKEAILTLERVLSQKIRAQQRELATWRQKREEASGKEDECLRTISEMEMAISVFRRALGLQSEVPPTDELDVLRYRSQTVSQSAYEIMQSAGGRARVTDITKVLLRAGKLKDSRIGYAVVTKALDRANQFRKVGRGEYSIVDDSLLAHLAATSGITEPVGPIDDESGA